MDLSVNRASRANSVAVLLYSLGCSVQLTTATASAVRRSFRNVPLSGFARGGRRVVCCCITPLLPPMTCTGPHPVVMHCRRPRRRPRCAAFRAVALSPLYLPMLMYCVAYVPVIMCTRTTAVPLSTTI
ncbi:hypothetical protein PF005_g9686 [Phytophthora fragariae]|uniref:Uncharacterized protein n=1 Tax=Phytophthora fragariae TaxID=53985 RepID=A0A6A3TPN9_9STRA|nr:hypothetical protein PF003_g14145 [Phytophthora fragariae]KAE9105225.1 hypothetical protein PF010_g13098 [Phytophthora fragariae]KAE9117502.1 hypothetical protein PF007_g9257 [Phytophthora fragariae]KAE9138318.1 hypothetical protein PF006_g13978 [Phytophthora fragariae]KAE9214803.1 hypothetical protein PF005_g9686 [Phytophthora fragariae]